MTGSETAKPDVLEILRAPFPPEAISHRPQPWCRACSDARGKVCADHKKTRCPKCRQNITEAHVDLSYVGHADVTDRLLSADPAWSWEPAYRDVDPEMLKAAIASGNAEIVRMVIDNSPPLFDSAAGGMWMNLTIHDHDGRAVTRLGYADAQGKSGPNAVKELIGDGIRNAGMRFGIALDLWSKSDRAAAASMPQSDGNPFHEPAASKSATSGTPGRAVRPADAQPPPAQSAAPTGEPDPDAQSYADEAYEARTLKTLKDVNTKAREAGKLAAFIRNPATGGVGGLGQLINWRKKQLEEIDRAFVALHKAAGTMSSGDIEEHVKKTTGADLEAATAEQLAAATAALKDSEAA